MSAGRKDQRIKEKEVGPGGPGGVGWPRVRSGLGGSAGRAGGGDVGDVAEVVLEEAGELGVLEVDVDEAGTGGALSPRICTPRRASGSGVCGGATRSTDPWSAELADGGLGVEGARVGQWAQQRWWARGARRRTQRHCARFVKKQAAAALALLRQIRYSHAATIAWRLPSAQ